MLISFAWDHTILLHLLSSSVIYCNILYCTLMYVYWSLRIADGSLHHLVWALMILISDGEQSSEAWKCSWQVGESNERRERWGGGSKRKKGAKNGEKWRNREREKGGERLKWEFESWPERGKETVRQKKRDSQVREIRRCIVKRERKKIK